MPTEFTIASSGNKVQLSNLYKNRSCFLIAGGPSFADVDKSLLDNPGIITMGLNNAIKTYRTDMHVIVDGLDHFVASAFKDPKVMNFVPRTLGGLRIFLSDKWRYSRYKVKHCPNVMLYERNAHFNSNTYLTEDTINWGNSGKFHDQDDGKNKGARSVLLAAIRILYELGFTRVFLLGVDFHMSNSNKYHFEQDRHEGSQKGNNSTYRKLENRFIKLRPKFEENNFYVYNCNPKSQLRAFDYVPYTDAVKIVLDEEFGGIDVKNERTEGLYDSKKTDEKKEADSYPDPEPIGPVEIAKPYKGQVRYEDLHISENWLKWGPKWAADEHHMGYALAGECWSYLERLIEPGMKTLETGCGLSTLLFGEMTDNHTAVEHEPEWYAELMKYEPNANVICCNLDDNKCYTALPEDKFDLIFIDGPTGRIGRAGLTDPIHSRIHDDTIVICDDINRGAELKMALEMADKYEMEMITKLCGDGREVGIMAKSHKIDKIEEKLSDIEYKVSLIKAREVQNEEVEEGSHGVIYYNRGTKCLQRIATSIWSLRKHYDGPITLINMGQVNELMKRYCDDMGIDIYQYKSYGFSNALADKGFVNKYTKYDKNVFLDGDTIVNGPIDELFDRLDDKSFIATEFSNHKSNRKPVKSRIRCFSMVFDDEYMKNAFKFGPGINTGIFAFRHDSDVFEKWQDLIETAVSNPPLLRCNQVNRMLDELCLQVIAHEFECLETVSNKWNASAKYGPKNGHIIHYHGNKHNGDRPLCDKWRENYREVTDKFPYLLEMQFDKNIAALTNEIRNGGESDLTVVTAVNGKYFKKFVNNFPGWMEYEWFKNKPMIIYYADVDKESLDNLVSEYDNIKLKHWTFEAETDREKMLSAFVLGVAEDVETEYWAKLDCDASIVNDPSDIPYYKSDIVGHRWGYTKSKGARPDTGKHFLNILDDIYPGDPIFNEEFDFEQKVKHRRHASFFCIYKTDFTKRVADFCKEHCEGVLPVPSEDTTTHYLANRWNCNIKYDNMKKYFKP